MFRMLRAKKLGSRGSLKRKRAMTKRELWKRDTQRFFKSESHRRHYTAKKRQLYLALKKKREFKYMCLNFLYRAKRMI